MEAANWIFDHNNNSSSNAANSNNYQSPGAQSSQNFLNFDSPDGNSDVSHNNLSFTNNDNSRVNSRHNTPHIHQSTLLSHNKEDIFLHGESPMDVLDPNHEHQLHQSHRQQQHHVINQQSHLKDSLNSWSPIPDLQDLDMNFFPGDQDFTVGSHFDVNNSNNETQHQKTHPGRIPPTPKSFEINAFQNPTDSNFLQNFASPVIDQHAQNSIRPDVVFTPLVSPAVTPMESMINKNHASLQQSSNFFSPLTSPALEAKSPVKLKKSSSPEESSSGSGSVAPKKKYNRKTPGNTPIVGPTIPGRIVKQSPIIKAKRSSSYANNISYHQQQNQHFQQIEDISQTEVMAPPKPRRSRKPSVQRSGSQNRSSTPATPATLMNFKVESTYANAPASSSPHVLPQNAESRRSSLSLKQSKDSDNEDGENSKDKKANHKLAEQGRRNRMNSAIQQLSQYVPDDFNDASAIPSKATTVENACSYIQQLVAENRYLKEKMKQFTLELESNESISPLETTNNHSSV